ncbi:hypothetical protein [Larkinella humicola]|uniref:Type II CBASS E2 protein domain-containing protein n=1 Tax=Larkinella humicola TaxID=2607654 RepID=A0A5N1J8Y2_9BACT|nr:hypothetical protein [Larkinella humicola]KAA9341141.1 hypothetical protein F0P93_30365 [Larkinella humicola]
MISDWQKLTVEKNMIENRFKSFRCNAVHRFSRKLISTGYIQPTEYSIIYKVRLEYPVWGIPKMYVLEPHIVQSVDIHIYSQGHLCLFHPAETPWKDTYHISDTIIPWTAEWLVFYELYQINGGIWLGKSIHHDTPTKA